MAIARWATPSGRNTNFAGTTLNSLPATGTNESNVVIYDNSGNRNLYGAVTVKLGSMTPTSGGSITLRVTINDGTDTSDKAGGDLYTSVLLGTTSAKVVVFPMVRLYPFSLRFSVINNSGGTFSASNNEMYVNPYNEDVT
jgi:hypothetical protein